MTKETTEETKVPKQKVMEKGSVLATKKGRIVALAKTIKVLK